MRTTIRLPDELYREVRKRSLEDGTTVTTFIERALRAALQPTRSPTGATFVAEPFHGSGLQPGVDLSDGSALLDRMES